LKPAVEISTMKNLEHFLGLPGRK